MKNQKILRLTQSIVNRQSKIVNLLIAAVIGFSSCGDWLDVVPEGVATIDMSFNSRQQALKYLATCYSYMPNENWQNNAALFGDEILMNYEWLSSGYPTQHNYDPQLISRGVQNATAPKCGRWTDMYQALRDCNTFLENVALVPDLLEWERDQWIAEIKVMKAWYHFLLVQMYGPVPIIRNNLPVSADVNQVKVVREPVDDCFQYIVELLDEATAGEQLPLHVLDIYSEMGRITKPIALTLKAKILVTAASPLFNGNSEQGTLENRDGTKLFNPNYEVNKWQKAMIACKEAIEWCEKANIILYEFPNSGLNPLTETISRQMSLRGAFNEGWNSEIIWANNKNRFSMNLGRPILNPSFVDISAGIYNCTGVPIKIALMFYTNNGVPLDEDNTRDNSILYDLRTAEPHESLLIRNGRETVDMNFDREPRFYAWLGFDGGIWYGQGRTDDKGDLWYLDCKNGGIDGRTENCTGYVPKKYLHYLSVVTSLTSASTVTYPWPIIRLSDLFLLYAEAINEAEGPDGTNSVEMFKYIDLVRKRAGLKGVKESWNTYANSQKYNNPTGMRQIIRQERMIELCFESQRFWDIRRWKTAPEHYRTPIEGWSVREWEAAAYYTPKVMFQQQFSIRDYFWPINTSDITNNRNLVQNIGW